MAKNVRISIDDPCREAWEKMLPADQGRFCAACQKQVIDFTGMSDAQLAAYFKKQSANSICGRFFQDQLDRDINSPRRRIPWARYFFQVAIPAFFMGSRAMAQGQVSRSRQESASLKLPVAIHAGQENKGLNTVTPLTQQSIRGIVVGDHERPVPFASIEVKGVSGRGVSADSSGRFILSSLDTGATLVISSVGYEPAELPLNSASAMQTGEVVVRLKTVTLENVVVQSGAIYTKGRIVVGTGTIKTTRSTTAELAKSPDELTPMIKVYPNPVVAGTNLNIGCQQLKAGYYMLALTNVNGQQVLQRETWIDGEMQVLNMDIPQVATGVYFLKLTNKESNKRFTQKIVVQ